MGNIFNWSIQRRRSQIQCLLSSRIWCSKTIQVNTRERRPHYSFHCLSSLSIQRIWSNYQLFVSLFWRNQTLSTHKILEDVCFSLSFLFCREKLSILDRVAVLKCENTLDQSVAIWLEIGTWNSDFDQVNQQNGKTKFIESTDLGQHRHFGNWTCWNSKTKQKSYKLNTKIRGIFFSMVGRCSHCCNLMSNRVDVSDLSVGARIRYGDNDLATIKYIGEVRHISKFYTILFSLRFG